MESSTELAADEAETAIWALPAGAPGPPPLIEPQIKARATKHVIISSLLELEGVARLPQPDAFSRHFAWSFLVASRPN